MREIKFRAWSKCGKYLDQVCEMTWTVGGLRAAGAGVYFCGCKERWSEKDLVGEHIILEQFTGLKDKNGKEIYEGDILRVANEDYLHEHDEDCDKDCEIGFDSEYGEKRMVVEWDDETSGYRLPADELFEDEFSYGLGGSGFVLERIGNIHENPELLKV